MTRTARQKARHAEAKRFRDAPTRKGCPTPDKRAYANEEAVHKALRGSKYLGLPIGIYECECKSLHLTKKRAER